VVYEFAWILVLISFLSPTFFNSAGITCLVVSPVERERGGSTKLADAL